MPKKTDLPLIPLRGLTVFPSTTVNFDVGRKKSVKAVEEAVKNMKEYIKEVNLEKDFK